MSSEILVEGKVCMHGPYLYWIDDDGEWLGATPYKENISEEEVERIKEELRKRYKKNYERNNN